MFDQLFSRSRAPDTGVGVHGDGSSDLPISNCISGELGGVGMSIGYSTYSPPSVPTIITIVTAKTIYEDSPSDSLISVVPTRSEPEEEASSSQAPTRTFTASGFLAAIFGIGIALSFWTPKNLWVFMGGFGLRREKRKQRNQQPKQTVRAAEEVTVNGDKLTSGQKDKGKARAIDADTEGESSTSKTERTPLLVGADTPKTFSSGVDLRDSGIDLTNGEETRVTRSEELPIHPEPSKSPAPEVDYDDMLKTIDEAEEFEHPPHETWTFADHKPSPTPSVRAESPAPQVEPESLVILPPAAAEEHDSCPYNNRMLSVERLPSPVVVDIPVTNGGGPTESRSHSSLSKPAASPITSPVEAPVSAPVSVKAPSLHKAISAESIPKDNSAEKEEDKEVEVPVKVKEEQVKAGPSAPEKVEVPKVEEPETPEVEVVQSPKVEKVATPKAEEVEPPKAKEVGTPVEAPIEAPAEAPAVVEVESPKVEQVEAPKAKEVEAPKAEEFEAPKPKEVEIPKVEVPKVEEVVEKPEEEIKKEEIKSTPVAIPALSTPQIELIPPTPAFNNGFSDEAKAFLKERAEELAEQKEEAEEADSKVKDYHKSIVDSIIHPHAEAVDADEPVIAMPTEFSERSDTLAVEHKGKDRVDDDLSIIDHPISSSPDQISLNEDAKDDARKEEEGLTTEEIPRPSSAKPPSTLGDDKSTRSESSPGRKSSLRRLGIGSHSRAASIDSTKKDTSLRRSLTSVFPGKKMKRENSAPASASSSQVKLGGELTPPPTPPETSDVPRPESRRSEKEKSTSRMSWNHAINKLSSKDKRDPLAKQTSDPEAAGKPDVAAESPETTEPLKPSSASMISTKDRPTTSGGKSIKDEDRPSKLPRRSSWFGKKKSSNNLSVADVAKSVSSTSLAPTKGEEPTAEAVLPLDKGKGVDRSPVEEPVSPKTTEVAPEAPKDVQIIEAPPAPLSEEEQKLANEEAAAAAAVIAATEKPAPRPQLKSRVTAMMAWRKKK